MALTIARLIRPAPWERTAQRGALRDLAGQRHHCAADARARCAGLGLPTEGHRFLAVLARAGPGAIAGEAEPRLSAELDSAGVPGLVGELAPGRVGILLALRPGRPRHPVVERLARAVRALDPEAVVCAGTEAGDLAHAARSFREAARVAEATPPGAPPPSGRAYHEPPTSACADCSTRCARTSGCRSTRSGSSGGWSSTTPGTAPIWSPPCATTWRRPGTRRRPPGWATSPGDGVPAPAHRGAASRPRPGIGRGACRVARGAHRTGGAAGRMTGFVRCPARPPRTAEGAAAVRAPSR